MERFLSLAIPTLELVQIPDDVVEQEEAIRDVNDRPIMRSAVAARADIVLTGDKDFLESGITRPQIMTAAEFLNV